jgi:hypothetical protein
MVHSILLVVRPELLVVFRASCSQLHRSSSQFMLLSKLGDALSSSPFLSFSHPLSPSLLCPRFFFFGIPTKLRQECGGCWGDLETDCSGLHREGGTCLKDHSWRQIIFPPHPSWRNSPQWIRASSLSGLHDHAQTHHTRSDSSGRVISPTQRLLPNNIQHSQETDVHAPGGIRTRNPSQRAAADPRRPRGHWARQVNYTPVLNKVLLYETRLMEAGRHTFLISGTGWRRFIIFTPPIAVFAGKGP